jgi:hypothetical protein
MSIFPYRKLLMGFRPKESEGILRNPEESRGIEGINEID